MQYAAISFLSQDFFTIHIRGVGQWTNRLYTYFEEEYRRQMEGKVEERSGIERLRGYATHVISNAAAAVMPFSIFHIVTFVFMRHIS